MGNVPRSSRPRCFGRPANKRSALQPTELALDDQASNTHSHTHNRHRHAFLAAFRPQGPSLQSTATSTPSQQPTKHTTTTAAASHANTPASSPSARSYSTTTHHNQQQPSRPLPIQQQSSRRRGSDSSSEGFRDALGADKWYIGGKTAGGEEKFFKMGVIKRVRSNDRLSLDRLSL